MSGTSKAFGGSGTEAKAMDIPENLPPAGDGTSPSTTNGSAGEIPMNFSLAIKNLFSDRLKFLATLAGVAFSVMLMAGQSAIFLGACRDITMMIDHSQADLWVMPTGVMSFEEALPLLTEFDRQSALVTPGIKRVTPVVSSFSSWQQPSGEANIVVLVSWEPNTAGPQPFDSPSAQGDGDRDVIIDRQYLDLLGAPGIGATAAVNDYSVRVFALSEDIRSFTHSPYIFVTPSQARKFLGLPGGSASFLLVNVDKPSDLESVRAKLRERMPNVDILTSDEFRTRSLDRWLYQTGAGQALMLGTALGALIGAAIIAQTMNMSVADHIYEYALLRAIGASKAYLQAILLVQVLAITTIGIILGLGVILILVPFSDRSPLMLTVNAKQLTLVILSTYAIGFLSSIVAIRKVRSIDPASLLK